MHRFLCVALFALVGLSRTEAQTLEDLGTWGWSGCYPEAVSGDGSIVVGSATYSSVWHAFRWTPSTGLVDIVPTLGMYWAVARYITRGGTYIAGYKFTPSGNRAAVWSSAGLSLFEPSSSYTSSYAEAMSESGTSVYGVLEQPGQRAVAWINGVLRYPTHLPGMNNSSFRGCSSDGRFAVGNQWDSNDPWLTKGFVYARDTQAVIDIGSLQGQYTILEAISSSGRFAFGTSVVNGVGHGVRWSAKFGLEDLTPRTTAEILFTAANKDGTAAVGRSGEAIYWSTTTGLITLRELAIRRGVAVGPWEFISATGISDEGNTIVGYGYTPSGARGFRMTLPKVRQRDFLFGS